MRELAKISGIPFAVSPDEPPPAEGGTNGPVYSSLVFECHGIWYNLSLIVPSALFVAYLASQAQKSFVKLTYGQSYIMIAYYALLWLISILNLLWCSLQVHQSFPD